MGAEKKQKLYTDEDIEILKTRLELKYVKKSCIANIFFSLFFSWLGLQRHYVKEYLKGGLCFLAFIMSIVILISLSYFLNVPIVISMTLFFVGWVVFTSVEAYKFYKKIKEENMAQDYLLLEEMKFILKKAELKPSLCKKQVLELQEINQNEDLKKYDKTIAILATFFSNVGGQRLYLKQYKKAVALFISFLFLFLLKTVSSPMSLWSWMSEILIGLIIIMELWLSNGLVEKKNKETQEKRIDALMALKRKRLKKIKKAKELKAKNEIENS